MAVIDEAMLREILTTWDGVIDQELYGLVETETHLRLGAVSLHRTRPEYRYTVSDALDDMSWFRAVPFDFPDLDLTGCAVVFHAADRPDDPAQAPEHFVGWVRAGREAELERWRAHMNGHVADLLYERRDHTEEHAAVVELEL